ncbi:sulfotransferase [Ichthyenterobacterium sp. W332]|uniref:Sulfotransferase n=1 Tax=Microcosmobacter mediterraneus TaxID=3075607 RepID=A0ABU2YMJ7_9FLAO|nr:sulfotransferase [Ichthyenterobacterium sp. W332]MDT0559388.1 sulfotransferase [Ichthyenterobacterium sp. W332]
MSKVINLIKEVTAWYFPKKEPKLFCIGLHKTGTTSLAKALTILGYRVKDYPTIRLYGNRFLWPRGTQINDYNCFTDSTIIPLYKRLDKKFPNSKFILTTRSLDSWLESCAKWPNFNETNVQKKRKIYRERILGDKNYNKSVYTQKYHEHLLDVKDYFKNRPDDIITLDVSQKDKWEILCSFLNKPIPSESFPHSNSGSNKRLILKIVEQFGFDAKSKELALNKFIDVKEVDEEKIISFLKSVANA